MSAVVEAPRLRVWRALTEPAEIVAWDESVVAPIDATDGYPQVGTALRWRYRLGSVQLVLHDHPHEVHPPERFRSRLMLGSLRFEQTYTLYEERALDGGGGVRTRLGLKLVASSSVPVMGAVVDRFEVRRIAVGRIDTSLRAVQKWCENPA